jgi:hypothetical protein
VAFCVGALSGATLVLHLRACASCRCEDVSRLELWANSDRCCATHISTQRADSGPSLRPQTKRARPKKADVRLRAYTLVTFLTRVKEWHHLRIIFALAIKASTRAINFSRPFTSGISPANSSELEWPSKSREVPSCSATNSSATSSDQLILLSAPSLICSFQRRTVSLKR